MNPKNVFGNLLMAINLLYHRIFQGATNIIYFLLHFLLHLLYHYKIRMVFLSWNFLGQATVIIFFKIYKQDTANNEREKPRFLNDVNNKMKRTRIGLGKTGEEERKSSDKKNRISKTKTNGYSKNNTTSKFWILLVCSR